MYKRQGTSCWNALEQFTRFAGGITPRFSCDGRLVMTKGGTGRSIEINGENVTELRAGGRRYGCLLYTSTEGERVQKTRSFIQPVIEKKISGPWEVTPLGRRDTSLFYWFCPEGVTIDRTENAVVTIGGTDYEIKELKPYRFSGRAVSYTHLEQARTFFSALNRGAAGNGLNDN